MNKREIIIVVALVLLFFSWGNLYRLFVPAPPVTEAPVEGGSTQTIHEVASTNGSPPDARIVAPRTNGTIAGVTNRAAEVAIPEPEVEEQTIVLRNEHLELTLSSRGGTVKSARVLGYRQTVDPASGPVDLSFTDARGLAYLQFPALSDSKNFVMEKTMNRDEVVFKRQTASGLLFTRTITLGDRYLVDIKDAFQNQSLNPIDLPKHQIQLGPMYTLEGESKMAGFNSLSVDSLSPGKKVKYWGGRINKVAKDRKGLVKEREDRAVDWVATKNKYFTQVLMPESGGQALSFYAYKTEKDEPVDHVFSSIEFGPEVLKPAEPFVREMIYYVGPKKLSELKGLGNDFSRIMEMGYLPAVSEIMLNLLNVIDRFTFGNYGLAIILMTFILKVLFWPITHKGTESMRRMQEFAPMIKEIGDKYKDNPQKKQTELMAFYKEHKINPLGGCLPMLVQIPVFIGLFFVLRSAIELRFAGFLWIDDLSEPERLIPFGFTIPMLGWDALNILPILMVISMVIQMKVAPTSAPTDQQQAQMQSMMMKIMPAMMLFLLYNFASGLALYWTAQNVFMIAQQLIYKKRKAMKDAAAAAAG